jgi:hypothetical protein
MRENLPAWAYRLDASIKGITSLATLYSKKLVAAKNRLLRRILIGIVRIARPYRFKPHMSRPLDFLQYFALVLYAPILFLILTGDEHGYSAFFTYAVGLIALVIFVIESIRLAKRFAHWKTVAKALYGALALALGFIASSIAKNYANSLTQIDPKYMSDFTGLLTVFLTWLFMLTTIPIGIFVLSACRFLLAQLYVSLFIFIQTPLLGLYPNIRHLPDLIWRLLTKQKTGFPKFRFVMLPVFHFVGATIACAAFLSPFSLLAAYHVETEKLLTRLLVFMDYRPNHGCDVASNSRVIFLERGYASVATRSGDSYRFSVIYCDLKPTK